MELHFPTAADLPRVYPLLAAQEQPAADYSFYAMLFWQQYYGELAVIDGFVTQCAEWDGRFVCLYPCGEGELRPVIEALRREAARRGLSFALRAVTEDKKQTLMRLYPGCFSFYPMRAAADYVYSVDELSQLRGRKYQQKRNYCHRFEVLYPDWHVEPVTAKNAALCAQMAQKWYDRHPKGMAADCERKAIALAAESFASLGMDGLLLYAAGDVAAFSLGGLMNARYYDVCFEKAFTEIDGAYAVINREFSRMVAEKYPHVEFLNREDDMGIAGLRKAKLSYRPTLLLEKNLAVWEETP